MYRLFCKHYIFAIVYVCAIVFTSCQSSRAVYSPAKKYEKKLLQEDFIVLKDILEKKHPSLYWYTSKDSMDAYFKKYYAILPDSMTESSFAWQIMAPLVEKIKCGHTSISFSKGYVRWAEGKKFPSFPLYLKVWADSMVVIGNMNAKDSIFKRGTYITSINGFSNRQLIQRMFNYLPQDGYAENSNYIRLSANFPYFHRNIFGVSKNYTIEYLDSNQHVQKTTIPVFIPKQDSSKKDSAVARVRRPKPTRKAIFNNIRRLEIDSSGKFAVMTLNGFTKGRLRKFFKHSFKTLKEQEVENLILDLRNNGGGKVGLSTLLTKYISRQKFRVADTVYAKSNTLAPYTKYISGKFLNTIQLKFISKKQKDGLYHLGWLERKTFQPKTKLHYDGKVYVLTSGPTFSASTLFCNAVKGQEGITLVGEETGGGWHGNNGIMIPDITLPNTKLRVRLPLFKLVQFQHVEKNGSGVVPDIFIGTSYDALIKGYDKKMDAVKKIIMADSLSN